MMPLSTTHYPNYYYYFFNCLLRVQVTDSCYELILPCMLWFPVLYLCLCLLVNECNEAQIYTLHIWMCRKIHSATESLRPSLKTGWGISASMNLWTCFQSSVRRLPENSRPYMPSKYMVMTHKTVVSRFSPQKWYNEICVCRFQCG